MTTRIPTDVSLGALGISGALVAHAFAPDQMANPAAGWPFTIVAPLAVSTNDTDVMERLHDDTQAEGAGTGQLYIPDNATHVTFISYWRAETGAGANRTVGHQYHGMTIGATAGAWATVQGADTAHTVAIAEDYVKLQSAAIVLGTLNLTAGSPGQIAESRDPTPVAGVNLTGDANLLLFVVVFS